MSSTFQTRDDEVARLLQRPDGEPPAGRAEAYLLGMALLAAGRVAEWRCSSIASSRWPSRTTRS